MRLIDADARVTVRSFDEEHEEYRLDEMSIEQALDFATEEGCPPIIDAIPTGWLNKVKLAANYAGDIELREAIQYLTFEWKRRQGVQDEQT